MVTSTWRVSLKSCKMVIWSCGTVSWKAILRSIAVYNSCLIDFFWWIQSSFWKWCFYCEAISDFKQGLVKCKNVLTAICFSCGIWMVYKTWLDNNLHDISMVDEWQNFSLKMYVTCLKHNTVHIVSAVSFHYSVAHTIKDIPGINPLTSIWHSALKHIQCLMGMSNFFSCFYTF